MTHLAPTSAAQSTAEYMNQSATEHRAAQWIAATTRQGTPGTPRRLHEELEELDCLIARMERITDRYEQQVRRSLFGRGAVRRRPQRATVIVSEQLALLLRPTPHVVWPPLSSLLDTTAQQSATTNPPWRDRCVATLDRLSAAPCPPITPWHDQPRGSNSEQQWRWWMLHAALTEAALTESRLRLTQHAHQPWTLPWSAAQEQWPTAVITPWAHALALPCPDTPPKPQLNRRKLADSRPTATPQGPHKNATTATCRPDETSSANVPQGTRCVDAAITGLLHQNGPDSSTLPLPARFRYRAADPYAVHAVFEQGGGDITWTFARDLLSDGMHARTGDGDVTVWTSTGRDQHDAARTYIELNPPSGTALVSLPRACVEEFLNQTTSIVPPGTEHAYVSSSLHDFETRLHQLTAYPGSSD
ncbi:SsgA family sporulation/cell division regulator [Streptomyces sp. NPDC056002]|uniref:SsgA family sporulation/cell division regulator n=1 Tax=Streptomyces sp. NPDC056002 TaxID=3345675 RepID=UPI0035DAB1D4